MVLYLRNEQAVALLGARLARYLSGEGSVYISGSLGAGKTTLCRGVIRAMGHRGAVKSPTFTLVEPYEIADRRVYHFDLYRLSDMNELDYIGIDEYFGPGVLCLVEWPERALGRLPPPDMEVRMIVDEADRQARRIIITANSLHGEQICQTLRQDYDQTTATVESGS